MEFWGHHYMQISCAVNTLRILYAHEYDENQFYQIYQLIIETQYQVIPRCCV